MSTPSPTPIAPTFASATPVSPTLYKAKGWDGIDAYHPTGIDFDSADHVIHCAIYGDPTDPKNAATSCIADHLSYKLPAIPGGEPGLLAQGVQQLGATKSQLAVWFDVEFAGQNANSHLTALANGTSVSWANETCAAIGSGIQCGNSKSTYGFTFTQAGYRVDSTK